MNLFEPIMPVLEFENQGIVIKEINSKPKPLALYLFTGSKEVEKKIINNISYGGGCINDTFIHLGNPYLPFSGVGASGIGSYAVVPKVLSNVGFQYKAHQGRRVH